MAGESILIVEDTELLRRMYEDRMRQDGYAVHVAGDGLECLQVLHSAKVDLILLDLIMPRMSGLEALETVKADPRTKDIPVIILSNLGQDADIERGLSMGAVDYMVKNSAKPADVEAKVRMTLDSMTGRQSAAPSYRLRVRDREGDADRFVAEARLPRRFWCPACEVELDLELVPRTDEPGWFDAHLTCALCGREFGA